ncbi:MAG: Aspartate semialdehyde dehydrogenase [Thermotoga sp. 50_1627]|uniref:aspartate-semialdehyde dehydrogenase n=1 Tax=Pseudothermotoga sp. TaxID=2033661 RepID=UPI00076D548D|nr:MAG: Aspartate semialdehyde dehydrogenase [Thermotoga sp. 50_64]KUK25242.1 MAG: Aspartate semialdehyde dehydrogenase [Thermotoga sp. 50_1627]MBC7116274.1 aspartate-semialdehyde dehydrogenase [Pseudothermotoga sp.]MDK2923288.1 aspartate-semialdehyde dehydrogenase [Pseudothermotoga sp.]HBT38702.1 aspartate-semialdehyde dehydrogenase [Pseudothermotoga sp.]
MKKKRVVILGATGTVGQRFVQLLSNHPFFEVVALAASEASVGKKYVEAVHWHLPCEIPENVRDMKILGMDSVFECDYIFSALPSDVAGPIETRLAEQGYIVFSNAASHRMDQDVPLLVPEVNLDHIKLAERQKTPGKLITNPNCSTIGLVMALKPIMDLFGIEFVNAVTMQAVSGAGYPGIPSLDILDNVIPYIKNEEEKMCSEPKKILGRLTEDGVNFATFDVVAQCNRVPVQDGHMISAYVETSEKVDLDELIRAIDNFKPLKDYKLFTAPDRPVVYLPDKDAPQPRLHRDLGGGMTVSVGRLARVSERALRFVALVHNTIRGAAGCAVLNAELYEVLYGRGV